MSTTKVAAPVPATAAAPSARPAADPNTQQHPPPSSTATAAPAVSSSNATAAASTAATAASTATTTATATTTPESIPRSKYKTFILSNGVFEVEQRYEIREIIGQGAYGVVCSALDMKNNTLVAIKKIEKRVRPPLVGQEDAERTQALPILPARERQHTHTLTVLTWYARA